MRRHRKAWVVILPILAYQAPFYILQTIIIKAGEDQYKIASLLFNSFFLSITTILLCINFYRSKSRILSFIKTFPIFIIYFLLFFIVMLQGLEGKDYWHFVIHYGVFFIPVLPSLVSGALFCRIRGRKGFFILGYIVGFIIISIILLLLLIAIITIMEQIQWTALAAAVFTLLMIFGIILIMVLPYIFIMLYNSYYFEKFKEIFHFSEEKPKFYPTEGIYISGNVYPVTKEQGLRDSSDNSDDGEEINKP